jgi:hypothetical protein
VPRYIVIHRFPGMNFYEGSPLIISRKSLKWNFSLVVGPKNNEPRAFLFQEAGKKGDSPGNFCRVFLLFCSLSLLHFAYHFLPALNFY